MGAVREPVPGFRLGDAIGDFLADLTHANRAAGTVRANRTDLASFTGFYRGPPEAITAAVLRGYFATQTHLAAATRARREATMASLLRWAYRHEVIEANPMDRLDRVRLPAPAPRGLAPGQVEAILAVIPRHRLRDRVLFGLIAQTGLRAGEALSVHVEDLDLTPGDEHLRGPGQGRASPHGAARRRPPGGAAAPLPHHRRLPVRAVVPGGEEPHRRPAALRLRAGPLGPVRRRSRGERDAAPAAPHPRRRPSLDAGVPLRDVQDYARHRDARTTRRYDHSRDSLDRSAAYAVAAYLG